MSPDNLAEIRPQSSPSTDVPGEIVSGVEELSRQMRQAFALVCAARLALAAGNQYTVDDLLEMAEEDLADLNYLRRVGNYLGVDTARKYAFDEQAGAR